jgi:hypothetical protein
MKLPDVKYFCREFYKRFSALDLKPLQLKFIESADLVSIALVKCNESEDIEAAIAVDQDTVRLLKINSFDEIDSLFTFAAPLDLYTNLLTLLLMCCHASGVTVSPAEALAATLGKKIKRWQELVTFICSLLPEEQGRIVVKENHKNAVKFLKAEFAVENDTLTISGLYESEIKFKDTLELVRAVLDSLSAVLNIRGYEIDPFSAQRQGLSP